MVRFVALSRPEAAAYLERFLGETPQALARTVELAASLDGPRPGIFDLSAASLDPLWGWAAPLLSWRDGYTPPAPGEPGGRVPLDVLEPEDELPSWFDPVVPGWARWSAESLSLIDGLARYLGETLVREVPTARWVAGHARARGYMYQNHPVVTGLPVDDSEPMASVAVIASRVLLPTPGPRTLGDLFHTWT
ncbi:hypothetical protein [Aquipuribacter hungaricus]|uniref:Uncharacterized protein n=1 Tax=Aquipuribacter hungaricus TaxID=545624 RepID=A0ABV7WJR4_9MICO